MRPRGDHGLGDGNPQADNVSRGGNTGRNTEHGFDLTVRNRGDRNTPNSKFTISQKVNLDQLLISDIGE